MKKYILVLFNRFQTLLLGLELDKICTMGCVSYLNGCVRIGKTVFCKGFLRALGYINYIKSSTYTLVEESYFLFNRYIYHVDCYRLSSMEGFRYLDIRDNVGERSIFLVEWPIIVHQKKGFLPDLDITITINYKNNYAQFRQIIIESITDLGVIVVNSLFCTKNFKYEI